MSRASAAHMSFAGGRGGLRDARIICKDSPLRRRLLLATARDRAAEAAVVTRHRFRDIPEVVAYPPV
jgi:hypothetical protein